MYTFLRFTQNKNNGFEAKNQNNHRNDYDYLLLSDEEYIKKVKNDISSLQIPNINKEFMIHNLINVKHKRENFYRENYEDFQNGIWCFIKKDINLNCKLSNDDLENFRFELNHLHSVNNLKDEIILALNDNTNKTNHKLYLHIAQMLDMFKNEIYVYDCNWERKLSLDDSLTLNTGTYLPKKFIRYLTVKS